MSIKTLFLLSLLLHALCLSAVGIPSLLNLRVVYGKPVLVVIAGLFGAPIGSMLNLVFTVIGSRFKDDPEPAFSLNQFVGAGLNAIGFLLMKLLSFRLLACIYLIFLLVATCSVVVMERDAQRQPKTQPVVSFDDDTVELVGRNDAP
jgi:hypothetical protein